MHLCLIDAETFRENSDHFESKSLISDQSVQNKTKMAALSTGAHKLTPWGSHYVLVYASWNFLVQVTWDMQSIP